MAASSLVSKPTRTFGSTWSGSRFKTESNMTGLNFAAHPAAFAVVVNRIISGKTNLPGNLSVNVNYNSATALNPYGKNYPVAEYFKRARRQNESEWSSALTLAWSPACGNFRRDRRPVQ